MRYGVAFIVAVVAAFIASAFFSGPIASGIVSGMRFESPDEVATMHMLVFMGSNLAALVVGWLAGLAIGASIEKPGGQL